MDLQRLRYLKTSVQAVKLNLESLILSSSGGVYPITRNKILKRNYSHGNNQHLTRFKYNNGKDFPVKDWKFQHNSVQKRRKNTNAWRPYTDLIENEKLQSFRSCMNNDCFTSKELGSITVDRRQYLTIHKSILLVRHYSRLAPKVERWRAKDQKDRRQLAKIVDCVPGKSSVGGGGFFKNFFGKLFGGKSNADLKCKNCRKQSGSSKLTEEKQENAVDDCDVDSNVEKANRCEEPRKKISKTKDDCDDKCNKQMESNTCNVCKTCASNTNLEKDDRSCAKSSKPRTDSSAICQTSNRNKPSNSCSSGAMSDRLKQLQTLEKCIGTLQQLIKNLKQEEEMKRAEKHITCPEPEKVICSSSKKPACPESEEPICPEPEKPTCPEPKKPACPVEKPICPVPVKPLCPEPFKKPACPQPRKPVCPEPKKSVCPEPKKSVCPEPKKPVCPEPKKPVCPEPKKPVCPEPKKPACPEPKKPLCPEPKKPACPEPKKPVCPEPKKTVWPEPKKSVCPEPKKPVCPEPKKPVCPEPKKPVCPEPKKTVCPEPKKSVCPEPKKPVCPEPKKPVCPEPKKAACPEPKKKSACPETEEPICPKAENSNEICGEEPAYKCGIIEDIIQPKKRHGKQSLRDKNDKYSACGKCGKEINKQEEDQCSQKVKNCIDDDESKNNCC